MSLTFTKVLAKISDHEVHPTDMQICQFVDGLLDGDALVHVTNHLKSCTQCQQAVERLEMPLEPFPQHLSDVDPEIVSRMQCLIDEHRSSC